MDPTYSYDEHLALIADLLAAPSVPSSSAAALGSSSAGSGVSVTLLLASLARHITTLDDSALAHLVSVLLSSPIWYTLGSNEHDAATTSAAAATSAVSFDDRSRRILEAVRHGIAGRLDLIRTDYGTGWRARRKASKSLGALWPILQDGDTASGIRLVVGTALVQALHDAPAAKRHKQTSPWSSIATTAQEQLLGLWADSRVPPCKTDAPPTQNDVLLPWLAAQALVDIPSERLHSLATGPFFDFAFSFVRSCFLDGRLFDSIDGDLAPTSEGLQWNVGNQGERCLLRRS